MSKSAGEVWEDLERLVDELAQLASGVQDLGPRVSAVEQDRAETDRRLASLESGLTRRSHELRTMQRRLGFAAAPIEDFPHPRGVKTPDSDRWTGPGPARA